MKIKMNIPTDNRSVDFISCDEIPHKRWAESIDRPGVFLRKSEHGSFLGLDVNNEIYCGDAKARNGRWLRDQFILLPEGTSAEIS